VFYGRGPILDSSVPWISMIKRPGDVELVNSASLLQRLVNSHSLFMAYGTGPWTAMKYWEASEPPVANESVVVLDQDGGHVEYARDEKLGPLIDLWPKYENGFLFATILAIAAEAWQVSLENMIKQDGWHHNGSTIWGRFVRP